MASSDPSTTPFTQASNGATSGGFFVGDIGATNARLAYVSPDTTAFSIRHYTCASFPNLAALLKTFLQDLSPDTLYQNQPPQVGAIAVPCPVVGDAVSFTNLPWHFSVQEMTRDLGLKKLVVVNDYEATAKSLPYLTASDYLSIGAPTTPPPSSPPAPMAVLGPGTGLGGCGLVPYLWQGKTHWVPAPTEIGHVSFSPVTPDQVDLMNWLRQVFGYATWENVVSGPGISTIFSYLLSQTTLSMPSSTLPSSATSGSSPSPDTAAEAPSSPTSLSTFQRLNDPLSALVEMEDTTSPGYGKAYPSKLRFQQFEGLTDVSIGVTDPVTGLPPPPQRDPLDSPPTLVDAIIYKPTNTGETSSTPPEYDAIKKLTPAQIMLCAMNHQGIKPNPLFAKELPSLPPGLDGLSNPGMTQGGAQASSNSMPGLSVGALATQTANMFFACLGTVAATMALTKGARGGLFLAGGILPKIDGLLQASKFRTFFQNKGPLSSTLAAIPTYLITHPAPALVGLVRQIWEEDQN